MIEIDGSQGEGGGQILRSCLALALVTGEPVRLARIRSGRKKPGLMRQHLTCVLAAAEIGSADVRGAELGSQELEFRPGKVRAGNYRFAIGTAGSTSLVLQTVLPALLSAGGPSELELEGGTHNPLAPPFEFLERSFAPVLRAMGATLELSIERHGFYPAGGGRVRARVGSSGKLERLRLLERGALRLRHARVLLARLPQAVAERELERVRERLGFDEAECTTQQVESQGPGNALVLEVEHAHVTEVVTSFGEKDVRAKTVADRAADELELYLKSDAPVGVHLADQLLIPFALAGGGSFRTLPVSLHTRTNAQIVQRFLPVEIAITEQGDFATRVDLRQRAVG
jgi:RNA 3'-terminal phosphate cyclase (ATP)